MILYMKFELTANRADCFSMVGLSREFGIMTNQKALFPVIMVNENGESIEGKASVAIEAHDLLHAIYIPSCYECYHRTISIVDAKSFA